MGKRAVFSQIKRLFASEFATIGVYHKLRAVLFTSGDDSEAKRRVIELIDSTGLVAVDLGSLAQGGALHQVGVPLSGLELHFMRRLR